MDYIGRVFSKNGIYLATGIAVIGATALYVQKTRMFTAERVCGIDYPEDVVILHQLGRGRERSIPSLGHFVMKLETYLRFNKIPFQPEFNLNISAGPKKKVPWIEFNGVKMGDSQMIIEFLNKEFKVDMNSHLTKLEKAQAWAIQKWIEEFMYWLNVHSRLLFLDEAFEEKIFSFPRWQKPFLKKWVGNMTYTVGIGRHSQKEVQDMVVDNLRKFAVLLGDKKFIMGDKMAVVDCAAFGILSEMRWATPSACQGRKLFQSGEISNVVNYLDRIKVQCWPDWDSLKATHDNKESRLIVENKF